MTAIYDMGDYARSVDRALTQVNNNVVEVHQQIAHVGDLALRLSEQVSSVSGQVSTVEAAQQRTQKDLKLLAEDFQAFVRRSECLARAQRAETRVVRIQDEIDHEFGHHKIVRRTAVGMLQAFDEGLVSEETVRTVSEELMIQTPRYWLAPALVALAAWAGDDEDLAERAVGEAFRRSPGRTSLLFALVLRRQGRQRMAVRWLRHYLMAQDPIRLRREFAVILESVAQGAFGAAGRELLHTTLERWQERLGGEAGDTELQDRQVRRWRAEIDSLRAPSAAAEFPRLAAMSPEWGTLDSVLGAARAQRALLDKYTAFTAPPEETPRWERLEDAVDDIVDRLVTGYDDEELPKYRDLALQRAIIDHDGDEDAARKTAELDEAARGESLDLLTLQTGAALAPEATGTSAATQRLALAAGTTWLDRAHGSFTADYRRAVPQEVHATYTATHDVGPADFELPPWTGLLSSPMEQLEQSLAAHWDTHLRPFLRRIRWQWLLILLRPAAITVFLTVLSALAGPMFAAVAAMALTVGFGWMYYQPVRLAWRGRTSAAVLLHQARHDSLLELRGAGAELVEWQGAYARANALDEKVRALIEQLAASPGAHASFDGRTIPSGVSA
jgi:hypothetical protein